MAQATRSLQFDPRELLEIAWRRKWVVLIPFLAIGGMGAFLARALPNVYRATTVILLEKPKVPETYVRSTVTTRIEDRLATINQQLLSRTWLERLINEIDLFREERATVPTEALIGRMRRDIQVQVEGRGKNRNAFTISYQGRDRRVVRDVTNRLAALFIEENSKVREEQAVDTAEFLETQLASLKETLSQQEREVREFKERYMGELPQQQEANLRALDRLQLQSGSLADQLRAAEDRRLLLQAQLAETPRFVHSSVPSGRVPVARARPAPAPAPDPAVVQLERARAVLADLQGRYTELHPDVIREKRKVAELESLIGGPGQAGTAPASRPPVASGSASAAGEAPDPDHAGSVPEVRQVPNPLYQQIEAQLAANEKEIKELRQSQNETAVLIRARQRNVENVPRLEQQLLELTRDYDNTRKAYDLLLSKKLEAQVAENLEKHQKGEQFLVLDPAMLPQSPYKPNRGLILVSGLALGFAVGAAGALGLEKLGHSIHRPGELKALLPQVPLIGTIPVIRDPRDVLRRRLVGVGVGVLTIALGVTAVAGAVQYKDEIVQLGVFEFLLR